MIKVFYDGWGIKGTVICREKEQIEYEKVKKAPLSKEFYLNDDDNKRLDLFGMLKLEGIFTAKDGKVNRDVMIFLTDKDGNHDPFEIVKGQDIYRHENGNSLKLIFDEPAPLDDVMPTEKPLNPKEKTTMLNIIYGLLEIAKKDTGKSQAEIINELVNYDYRGLKKSTLEKYFSEANKIHQRG